MLTSATQDPHLLILYLSVSYEKICLPVCVSQREAEMKSCLNLKTLTDCF